MKKSSKKGLGIGIALVVIAAVVGGYYYFSAPAEAEVEETVTKAVVEKKDIIIGMAADGTVEYAETDLKFSGSGVLKEIYVEEGQEVHRGDVLAKLDDQSLQNQVTQSLANYNIAVEKYEKLLAGPSDADVQSKQVAVDNAENNLRIQQTIYDYKLSLYNEGKISESDLLSEEAKLEGAKAQLATAESQLVLLMEIDPYDLESAKQSVEQAAASLATARENLNDAVLVAPADGVIFAINGNVGEYLSSGGSSFIQLGATQPTVQASVIEEDISKVVIGQTVEVEFIALPDVLYSGIVTAISPNPTIDQTGIVTYQVSMALDQPDETIKNGMTAEINFISQQAKDVLTAPVEAIKRTDGVSKVEVDKGNGLTEFVEVKTGLTDGRTVEIKTGLQEGDQVLIRKTVKK